MFITMKNHLTNTFWVYVIPTIVQPFNIILVKDLCGVIAKIFTGGSRAGRGRCPYDILESDPSCMYTDPGNHCYFHGSGTVEFFPGYIDLHNRPEIIFLQYLLYQYINQASSLAMTVKKNSECLSMNMASLATQQTSTSIRMTVSVVVVLPILFIYPMFQKHFVKGL